MCLYSKTKDTGGFATNHGNSMRIFLRLFVAIWCPSIGISIISQLHSVHLHVKPDFSINQDSGNEICFQNENRKQTRNQETGEFSSGYLVSIHWRLYSMNTSSVCLHVKPDFYN